MTDDLDLIASLDTGELENVRVALDGVNISAERVARTMSRTFANAIVSGKSFEQVLKSLAESLARMALNAGLKPFQQGLASLIGTVTSSMLTPGTGAPVVAPFAEGGIVSKPVFFGHQGGLGLMGERGAEAIVPLARGPDGRLGLAARGGASSPVNVTVNITTPDVQGFQRSQVQISGALARAVSRGRRGI